MELEERIKGTCGASMAKVLPAVKRAPSVNPYYSASDDRLLEYDATEVLFQEQTPFQKVEIVATKSYGNMLLLDNLQNLAEADLEYTHGVMNKGVDSYKGKNVLILGGGDGALLKELLVEDPNFVTMIDIDEAVMRGCREHLRGACGDVLDTYKTDKYHVIVGDALAHLRDYHAAGRTFDVVISDLTDLPISPEPVGDKWEFLKEVMTLAMKVLVPFKGRLMTHVIGVQHTHTIGQFETMCKSISEGLAVTRSARFVPSFMEKWVFFQLTKGV